MIKMTFSILNEKEKVFFIIILILFFFTSSLEALGIGLIYPILNLILNESYLENIYYKKYLSDLNLSKFQVIYISLIFLPLFYLIKNLSIFFVKYFTFRYRKIIDLRVTKQVMSKYLMISYEKIYTKTTEEIFKNISFAREFSTTIFALLNIIHEIFVYIFIIFLLLILNSKLVFLIFILFFTIIFIFYLVGKKILYKLGDRYQQNFQSIVKLIVETVSGIKTIKLIGKEKYFLEKIQKKNLNEANIRNVTDLFLQIPSHTVEICSVFSVSVIIVILAYYQKNFNEIIGTVAVFGLALTRLMPSTTRLIAYMQTLRFNLPKTKIIYEELHTFYNKDYLEHLNSKEKSKKKIIFKNNIKFNKVNFFFNNKKKIFFNLSLDIKKKKVIGIFGPSGSGKSTFNNLLTGLLKPNAGEILVDGINIKENIRSWQDGIGFVSQNPFFSNDTIKNNILFGENSRDFRINDFKNAVKLSRLNELLKSLPNGYNTLIGEKGINFSSGQLQRLSIARSLYRNPNVLILDEATNALDENNEKQFFNCIKKLKRKITVIIVSHKKSNFYFCDEIYKLSNYKLNKTI
jgi:ABC-type bacteriocin/lantibiotic exporter with double-glycine peptidase domain